MKPQPFPEATKNLARPPSMTDEECGPLPIWNDGNICVSCWRPSWRERLSIMIFGRVWLHVHSGVTQPPVAVVGARSQFQPAEGACDNG